MADNLSPLVNLDLINQIYKTINAQITERVYDPEYNSEVTLGTENHRYKSAYLGALNVNNGATVNKLNELILASKSAGFEISGGTTAKKLTVESDAKVSGALTVSATTTISKPLTVQADTGITGNLTVSAATNIIKGLTVGATTTNTGAVTIRSKGTSPTTITGPNNGEAKLIDGTYTTSATTENNTVPTEDKLLKIKKVDANTFLAGPATGTDLKVPEYRTIQASDLPKAGEDTSGIITTEAQTFAGVKTFNETISGSINGNAATASQVETVKASTSINANHYISFVNSNNTTATAETVYTSSNLTYNPSTGTLGATKLAGELGASNVTGTLRVEHGGTGINSFAAGDILYASDASTLTALKKGKDGQVLKLSGGEPRWGTDNTPTTFEWIGGDTEGPKGSLSGDGMTAVNFAAIPSAGEKTSGVVTIGNQSFKGVKTFTDETDSNTDCTAGAVIIKGGLSVAKNIYAAAVHNAVWNDLVDCMEVPEDTSLEYGYCYSWKGDSVIRSSRSSKNCIGIHSNTAGFVMGEKKTKTIQAAVAGFVLAYVDKIYPEGTPLTWGDNGTLTKCSLLKRFLHPERVIATFYKEEREEKWHNLPVSGRHWVKVA